MKSAGRLFIIFVIIINLISCVKPSDQVSFSSVKISENRLSRIDSLINSYVDQKKINGAVAYISQGKKTSYYKAFGVDDLDKNNAMVTDAIFRIASQSKAVTSVAAMILYEEGKFLLDDPVSKYLPEFDNPQVIDKFNEKDTTYTLKPATREITIRDLLTHTSGINYPKIGSPDMVKIYAKYDIPVGFESRKVLLEEKINRLAKLPLSHQPGEKFTYGLNSDVLGCLIEKLSGMRFDEFLRQHIFEPLNMKDTYFYIPEEKQSRLVAAYTVNEKQEMVKWNSTMKTFVDSEYPLSEGTYFSGGAGLSSTIKDYATFLQMLLNGGIYNGMRILAQRTVEIMTVNQIGDIDVGVNKFGLGFEITTEKGEAQLGVSQGSFSWGGFFGTTYWVDPEEKLVCLLFCQQYPMPDDLINKYKVMVYSSLEK